MTMKIIGYVPLGRDGKPLMSPLKGHYYTSPALAKKYSPIKDYIPIYSGFSDDP